MSSGNNIKLCACKGIRKCALCSNDENDAVTDSQIKTYVFCLSCKTCYLVSKNEDIRIKSDCALNETCGVPLISGVTVVQNFINEKDESFLVQQIEQVKWVDSQSGRLKQDYGPKVNFKKKKLKLNTFTGLPIYSRFLVDKLHTINEFKDFATVELCNLKYQSDRGASIDAHFDDFWLWGPRLVTFNILSDSYLTMTPSVKLIELSNELVNCKVLIPLERYSMIVLNGDARYKWLHAIERNHVKNTRIAVTLRELTDEFKGNGHEAVIGSMVEKLALSYKGISVGELEEFYSKFNCNKRETAIQSNDIPIDEKLKVSLVSNYECFKNASLLKLKSQNDLTYIAQIDENQFTVNVLNATRDTEHLNEIEKFQSFLFTSANLEFSEVPKIYESINKKFIVKLDSQFYCVQDGFNKETTLNLDLIQVGKSIAELHLKSMQYLTENTIVADIFTKYHLDVDQKLEDIYLLQIDDLQKSKLIAVIKNFKHISSKFKLKKGFIHGNIKPSNIFILENKRLGVDGFIQMDYSYYLFDLAIALSNFIIFNLHDSSEITEVCLKIGQSILYAYQSIMLDKMENECLNWSILFTLALRITKTEADEDFQKYWNLFEFLFLEEMTFTL